MDLPQRKRLPHAMPEWASEGSFFFITINCAPRGLNQLCVAGKGGAVLASAAFQHDRQVWHCRLLLLMPDHLHGILAFQREPGIKRTITQWKRYVAAKIGIEWQRDFFDHRLRNHHERMEKTCYIEMNPVRGGLCERAEDWPWIYRPKDRLSPSW